MLNRFIEAAGVACVAVVCAGCCGTLQCGDGCATGSPYAFMKYDCTCETCGAGFCADCGGDCTCGAQVDCGEACTCGSGCTDGACGGSCGGKCGGGCCCGQRSPCWLLHQLCACTGCGEFYWNEWYCDPPRCAEPCDCYGNWVGAGHSDYFRAPYRSQVGHYAAKDAGPPPLETADAAANPFANGNGGSETALYEDDDLSAELR